MMHLPLSRHTSGFRTYLKKRRSFSVAAAGLLLIVGAFFITRGATPQDSELAYIEHSSLGQNAGSVVPASCDSNNPLATTYVDAAGTTQMSGSHFLNDCTAKCPDGTVYDPYFNPDACIKACASNAGQTCYLTNSCGQKSAPGVIGCDGTCGNKYETTKFTQSGHYLGTYDDFRNGPADVCSQLAKRTMVAGNSYACAPNLNRQGTSCASYAGDSGTCATYSTNYYAESRSNGNWGRFSAGQNWCQDTGVEWVQCGPAISAPPDSNCPVTTNQTTPTSPTSPPTTPTSPTSPGTVVNGTCDNSAKVFCTSGTYKAVSGTTWQCVGSNGGTTASCTLSTTPTTPTTPATPTTTPAPTAALSASPNPVAYNGRSTLSWSSTNATSCTAGGPWSNQGTLSGGGLTDPLTAATTFTFQCTGPGGTSPLQSVTIGVGPQPCQNSAANPPACDQCPTGDAYQGSSCVACSNGGCTGSGGTPTGPTNPTGGLTCNNGTINPPACDALPPSCSVLKATPTDIRTGGTVTLTWSCQNAASCVAVSNPDGFSTGGALAGNDPTVSPTATSGKVTYGINCGGVLFNFPPVTVHAPVVSLEASSNRVQTGGRVTLSGSGSDVIGCSITDSSGNTIQPYSLATGGSWSASPTVSSLSGQRIFTLVCDAVAGPPISDSVTVNVVPLFQQF